MGAGLKDGNGLGVGGVVMTGAAVGTGGSGLFAEPGVADVDGANPPKLFVLQAVRSPQQPSRQSVRSFCFTHYCVPLYTPTFAVRSNAERNESHERLVCSASCTTFGRSRSSGFKRTM